MKEKVKKTYFIFNVVFFSLAIYILIYPLFFKMVENINPNITKCAFLKLTGKPCPLCGGTRYLKNIGTVFSDFSYIFSPFGFIISFTCFEVIFRTINLILLKFNKYNKRLFNFIINFDVTIHILVFIIFIGYEIYYVLNI